MSKDDRQFCERALEMMYKAGWFGFEGGWQCFKLLIELARGRYDN